MLIVGSLVRRRLCLVALLSVSLAGAACSHAKPKEESDEVAESAEKPAETAEEKQTSPEGDQSDCDQLADKLETSLEKTADKFEFPGALVVLDAPGCPNVTFSTGLGVIEPKTPMKADMVYRVGSITKMFVAAVMLQLVEEDELALEDTVDQWVPDVPNASKATVRQILNHTSGIPKYIDDGFRKKVMTDPTREWKPEELLSRISDREPAFAPGEDWAYSNSNYIIAGLIIEEVTGSSVGTQIRKRLLDPLELSHTYFEVEEEVDEPMAHPYFRGKDFLETTRSWTWAAGALASTAGDQLTWIDALLDGEVVSDASLKEMMEFVDTGHDTRRFGMGIERVGRGDAGGPLLGYNGRGPGVMADLYAVEGEDCGVAVYVNSDGVFNEKARGASTALVKTALSHCGE